MKTSNSTPPDSAPTPNRNKKDNQNPNSGLDLTPVPERVVDQHWDTIGFFKKSIALFKQNPKLLLLGVLVLTLAGGSSSNLRINNFFNSNDNSDQEIQEESAPEQQAPDPIFEDYQAEESVTTSQKNNTQTVTTKLETKTSETTSTDQSQLDTSENLATDEEAEKNWVEELTNNEQFVQYFDFIDYQHLDFEHLASIVEQLPQSVEQAYHSTPGWVFLLAGLQILAFIIYGIILALATSAWAVTALIKGIKTAAEAKQPNQWSLSQVCRQSLAHIKPMIWIKIYPWLKLTVRFLAYFLGAAILFAVLTGAASITQSGILSGLASFLTGLGSVIILIWYLISAVKTTMAITLGQRHLVYQDLKAKEAFARGQETITGKIWKIIGQMLAHGLFSIIGGFVIAIPFLITIFVFFANNLSNFEQNKWSEIVTGSWIITFIISLIVIAVLLSLFSICTQVIYNSNWHWVYQLLTTGNIETEVKEESASKLSHQQEPKKKQLATFGQRLMAHCSDHLILSLIPTSGLLFVVMAGSTTELFQRLLQFTILIMMPYITFRIFYQVWFVYNQGATPGKKLWGLKIINSHQPKQKLPTLLAFVREIIVKKVSASFLGLGYLWMVGRQDNHTWHDMLVGTQVVVARKQPALVSWLIFLGLMATKFYLWFRVISIIITTIATI